VQFYQDRWNERNLKEIGLNERQIKAVMYVKERGKITNKEYQDIAGTIKKTSSRDLVDLVKKGIFSQSGVTGKGTFYVLKRTKGT